MQKVHVLIRVVLALIVVDDLAALSNAVLVAPLLIRDGGEVLRTVPWWIVSHQSVLSLIFNV